MFPTESLIRAPLLASGATEEPQQTQQQQVTKQEKVAGEWLLNSATDVSCFPPGTTSLQERELVTLEKMKQIEELRLKVGRFPYNKKEHAANTKQMVDLVLNFAYLMPPGREKQDFLSDALRMMGDACMKAYNSSGFLHYTNLVYIKLLVSALEGAAGPLSADGSGPFTPYQQELLKDLIDKKINQPWLGIREDINTRMTSSRDLPTMRFIMLLDKVGLHMHS